MVVGPSPNQLHHLHLIKWLLSPSAGLPSPPPHPGLLHIAPPAAARPSMRHRITTGIGQTENENNVHHWSNLNSNPNMWHHLASFGPGLSELHMV
jgi:hypothetical protein